MDNEDEDLISCTLGGSSLTFGKQDIFEAIGVPSTGRALEEMKVEIASVESSKRVLGYGANGRLHTKCDPLHVFARATQTNLLPILNPKTAMQKNSLFLWELVDSTCTEISNGCHFTIRSLLNRKGLVTRDLGRYIECYRFAVLYPAQSATALKSQMDAYQRKLKKEEHEKMEEVLGEIWSLKEVVSNIDRKFDVSQVDSKQQPMEKTDTVMEIPPSPVPKHAILKIILWI